jgi:hypothetical protein
MCFAYLRFASLLLVFCVVGGCGGQPALRQATTVPAAVTTPVKPTSDSASVAAARRFLTSWGAGELIQIGFERAMEEQRNNQPGMAELAGRVFRELKTPELEDIAARVYARHMSLEQLTELAKFTETPLGERFFRVATAAALDSKNSDHPAIMRKFNADELTLILKFSQSDVFRALQAQLPAINSELKEEGSKFGAEKLREYLRTH